MLPIIYDRVQRVRYQQRMRRLFGTSLIALWPMDDAVGSTTMLDASGNGRNGTHSNVTLGQPGIGDGGSAASYNGTTSYSNAYSASLAAAFNGAEGTLACWIRASAAGVWNDGTVRYVANFQADGSNRVELATSGFGSFIWRYRAGGTIKAVSLAVSSMAWLHITLTWSDSADQMIAYINGTQTGVTQTGLGTWAGSLLSTTSAIGAQTTVPNNVWSGSIDLPDILNRAATAAEVAEMARV